MIPSVIRYSSDITAAHILSPGKRDIYSLVPRGFTQQNQAVEAKSFMFLGSISSPAATVTDAVVFQIPTGVHLAVRAMMCSGISEGSHISGGGGGLITGSAA